MVIRFECFSQGKKIIEIMTDSNKIYLVNNEKNPIILEEEKQEKKVKEIGVVKKVKNIYILENKNKVILVNRTNIELAQLETGDIIEFSNFQIKISIYAIELHQAAVEVEHKTGEKKIYTINSPLIFIGSPDKADIPAFEKNPFLPISDYSAAIVIRENSFELIPINPSVVRFKMKELKLPIMLENDTSFEIGTSKFTFKFQN